VTELPKKMTLEEMRRMSWYCQPEQPLPTYLEDTSQCEHKAARSTDEEDGSDIEAERDKRVGAHNEESDAGKLAEWFETLGEREEARVDDRTHGCVIVQRAERVHLTCQLRPTA
jgi:hypothetical protein